MYRVVQRLTFLIKGWKKREAKKTLKYPPEPLPAKLTAHPMAAMAIISVNPIQKILLL